MMSSSFSGMDIYPQYFGSFALLSISQFGKSIPADSVEIDEPMYIFMPNRSLMAVSRAFALNCWLMNAR